MASGRKLPFRKVKVEFNQQILKHYWKRHLESEHQQPHLFSSVHVFESLPSTNQMAWQLLSQGEKRGCVVIAQQQTAGKGQWGRQWLSPQGGLYISLGIPLQLEVANGYQLTLASAWGIASQLKNCGVEARIKWPNDLVLNRRKLGGILTETKVQQGQITQVVIGVGVNWKNPVPETGINLHSWQNENLWPISGLEMLAAQVLLGIQSGLDCLQDEGISIVLSRYLDLLINLGDQVCVNIPFSGENKDNLLETRVLATVVGVTPQGHLRLQTSGNREEIIQGEISLAPGKISLGYTQFSV